jgi:hypothetical protein
MARASTFLDRVKGTPSNPFTREEHHANLDELTEEVIGKDQATQLFDLIDRLDPATPMRTLTALLRRRATRHEARQRVSKEVRWIVIFVEW